MNVLSATLVLLAAGLGAFDARAQVVLHRNAEDYRQHRGEEVGRYVDIVPSMGRYVLLVTKDGRDRKVKCRGLWGFSYKDVLFRIYADANVPVRLMKEGAMCYYENGFAHLRMLRDGTEVAIIDQGNKAYLSRDLDSPIVPAIFKADDTHSNSARFRGKHPQFEPLFQCIGDADDLERDRQCVVDFEAALEGGR